MELLIDEILFDLSLKGDALVLAYMEVVYAKINVFLGILLEYSFGINGYWEHTFHH